ncbi:hypothetical protein BJX76DRAFT_341832 [Aspergillus varians]
MDVNPEDPEVFQQPTTAITRVLCLCLMSFQSSIRGQSWRNTARSKLPLWETSFNYTWSQIPNEELQQAPPDSEYASSEHTGSEYLPSSPLKSTERGAQSRTRSQAGCAPMVTTPQHTDSSDSDSGPAAQGRKRGFSQVTSSPLTRLSSTRPVDRSPPPGGRHQQHTASYCTQRCLLNLKERGLLDDRCPNVNLHRDGPHGDRHRIDAEQLVQMLKQQLDLDLDHNCTPFGVCGSYGAPFKITCARYGYTVVGKGTTSRLWKVVSREEEVYRVLQKAQGSAVPVFLGTVDLNMIYFLHGAGEIRHMLLMGWGGESLGKTEEDSIRHEISRSRRQIRMLGVIHQDLRRENMLWNHELGRVLIIDFHRSQVDRRPMEKRVGSMKRSLDQVGRSKRPRLMPT